jgi:hypothetical protein
VRIVDDRRSLRLGFGAVRRRQLERVLPAQAAQKTHQAGANHDGGERHVKEKNGDEGEGGDGPHHRVAQGLLANAQHGGRDDGQHRWFQTVEKGGDPRDVAVNGVNVRKREQNHRPGQDEQGARHNPAPRPMQQPTAVGGELLGLWSGQQHAVVKGVEKALLPDPPTLLDQLRVHDRNLPRRSAEADQTEF